MDLIIGAGVSGISYANFTRDDFLIVERDATPGGYCRTTKRNGYVWDYSGHFFHFRHPYIERYVCQNIAPESLVNAEKHTQILYNRRYVDFPFQKNIHQLDKEEFIDCLYDLFTAPEKTPRTFKEMVYANLGKSIAEKFLIPYNEKLYACDLDHLDMDAMGRFFPKASREEIVRNFREKDNASYNSRFTYSRNGAIEYIRSLLKNIDESKITYNETLLKIDSIRKIAVTDRREIRYDRLISTIPFPELLSKTGIAFPDGLFSWNKVLVFNLGFDRKGNDRVNSWVYIPSKEFIFYRVGYYDNILSDDRMSLYVEIGFPRNAVLQSKSDYLDRVLRDLKKAGIISNQNLIDYEVILMDPAYVHINRESLLAVSLYKERMARHDIFSIGRYGSWTYCSIEDNILEAENLAQQLIDRSPVLSQIE